jgi:UDP-3-O-[3-hydroxymyristoyl] glucosamine N-acyltransferase
MEDVPAGALLVGSPAKPVREFAREIATLKKLARRDGGSSRSVD